MAATTGARRSALARTRRALAMLGIRAAFGALEPTAPGYGARWAERLWFTVPSTEGRWRGELPAGQTVTVAVNDRPVVTEQWGGGPIVVLLHGWGGQRSDLAALVGPLVRAGHQVIAIDAPGHGESEWGAAGRRRSTILEFTDALMALCAVQGPAHAVVGHSIGCMAVAVALREGLAVHRLVFIAPMADVRPYTKEFARRLGFGDRIRTRMEARIERRVNKPLAFFDIPSMAQHMRTPQVLLIHDEDDRETPWTDSAAIEGTWPDARLITTRGLGHRRILREPAVLDQVVQFIAADERADAAEAS
jgi:pimeloyl-ACP methyl ester carboxylesterase